MADLDTIKKTLQQALDTEDAHRLSRQLSEAEAYQVYVSSLYRTAQSLLSQKRGQLFDPSLGSEDRRKIDLEFKVRGEQESTDILYDLANILKQRISLGQTLLKNMRAELESGVTVV